MSRITRLATFRSSAILIFVLLTFSSQLEARVGPRSEKDFGERWLKRMKEQGGLTETESGVAYRQLQVGPGKLKPLNEDDDIEV